MLTYVTLTGKYADGSGQPNAGSVTFAPGASLTDATDQATIRMSPITVQLSQDGTFTQRLLATDNSSVAPAGWQWTVTERITGLPPNKWTTPLAYANGATQDISALTDTPVTVQPGGSSSWGLQVLAGSQAQQVITFTASDGTPYPITGATWEYVVRAAGTATGAPLIDITTTSSADGQITVPGSGLSQVELTISPSATAALAPGTYAHALWMNPGLSTAFTWLSGQLTIEANPQP